MSTTAQQEAMATKENRILEDVDELVSTVPAYTFHGTIPHVVAALKEFEDGFVFVPVQKPRVEGDFYLANLFGAENPKSLPEYSQTSGYYCLLPSWEALEEVGKLLGNEERFEATAIVQKQISVTVRDLKTPAAPPILYYINSYNRTTREAIVLGFAFLAFRYMHRRSGTSKDDLHVLTTFMESEENYKKATKLMRDYTVTSKTLAALSEKAKLPVQKLAAHMFGLNREHINAFVERGEEQALLWQMFRSRYESDEGKLPNLVDLIAFLHDIYHFHMQDGHFDVATKFIANASTYLTKKVLPYVQVMDVI